LKGMTQITAKKYRRRITTDTFPVIISGETKKDKKKGEICCRIKEWGKEKTEA